MSKITELLAYFCKHYPVHARDHLSKTRLLKMVYLADWQAAVERAGRGPITDVTWEFYHYGPYSEEVYDDALKHLDLFDIKMTRNVMGNYAQLFSLKTPDYTPDLDEQEEKIAAKVIEDTCDLSWSGFIEHIYDTFPIRHSRRYSHLDLHRLAKDCAREEGEWPPLQWLRSLKSSI